MEDNWESGETFRCQFDNSNRSGDYCHYPIDRVSTGIEDLANVSEDYAYGVYHEILDEGDVG